MVRLGIQDGLHIISFSTLVPLHTLPLFINPVAQLLLAEVVSHPQASLAEVSPVVEAEAGKT